MSLTWPPPNSQKPPDDEPLIHSLHRDTLNGLLRAPSRPHTPNSFKLRNLGTGSQSGQPAEPESSVEEDPQVVRFRELFQETENKLATLFNDVGQVIVPQRRNIDDAPVVESAPDAADSAPVPGLISKKRKLDDDDYDDYDDDDEDEETALDAARASPLRDKPNKVQVLADATSSPKARPVLPPQHYARFYKSSSQGWRI